MILPKFIKNYIVGFSMKDLLYLFIIIAIVVIKLRGCGKGPVDDIKPPVLAPVTQKTDKKGSKYDQIKGVIYTQAQMDHVADSFEKVLKQGKVRQVVQTVSVPVHDTVPVPVYIDTAHHLLSAVDSNKNYKQTFTGNYKEGIGKFTLYVTPDTATYVSSVKSHLFKRDDFNVNIYHTNDMFRPALGSAYTGKLPRTLFDMDLFVGYDFFRKQVVVAPGIGIHIFSVKTRR